MSVNMQDLVPSTKPDSTQQSGCRHDAQAADHAFRHEQSRSYDTAANAQRNQHYSHKTGNDDGARELQRQLPPGEIKQLVRGHTLSSSVFVRSPAAEFNESHNSIAQAA
jgi:hypothetical protein